MSETPTIPTVTIKGQTFEIPVLCTGQVKREWPKFFEALKAAQQMEGSEAIPAAASAQSDILLLALRNRYPEISMEDVETLPYTEMAAAVKAVIEGVVRPKATAPATTTENASL